MSTKHTPATPLPWKSHCSSNQFSKSGLVCRVVGNIDPGPRGLGDDVADVSTFYEGPATFTKEQGAQNSAYIAHAANAYPKLVEALRSLIPDLTYGTTDRWKGAGSEPLRALLRELGEAS